MKIFASHIGDQIIEELALFLTSGMQIQPALASIEQESRTKTSSDIVSSIRKDIEQGIALSAAFERAGIFSHAAVALVKIGERTGTLSESMVLLEQMAGKNRIFRSRIVSASVYPLVVFGIALIVGGMITLGILPRLALIFSQLRVELPAITKILITLGSFIGRMRIDWFIVFTVSGIIAGAFILVRHHVRPALTEIVFHIPGVHRMMKETEIGRFGYLSGTMLGAGVPIAEVMRSIASSTTFSSYRTVYASVADGLEQGVSFAQSLRDAPYGAVLIPVSVHGMISAGERSGLLQNTLSKVGAVYEQKGEATAKNLATLLEPLLLFIVWLAVLFIAIAVILPIYSLIGELQTSS